MVLELSHSESTSPQQVFTSCTNNEELVSLVPQTRDFGQQHITSSATSDVVHSHHTKASEAFLLGEEMGTEVSPKCGSCRCGKCPITGHTYSFKEEQELKLVNSKLRYDAEKSRWIAGYPWVLDPSMLPNNYAAAFATLKNTERRLKTEPEWAEKYSSQIMDMETRQVARKMTTEEMNNWDGPVFYLSHLAVEQPKSLTTPVRIVFNSSQLYRGVSLNSFLAKGPDSFKNNLLGMLIRFRENAVVLVGDIRKMYNSVFLDELEQHTHRFLWRDLENRPPDTWCITRLNMGDKPAGTIAIEAKDRTAEMFRSVNPRASDLLIQSSYVDDIIDSVESFPVAQVLSKDANTILAKGGFKVKGWTYGGVDVPGASQEISYVLGVGWRAADDVILFTISLNFSEKKRNVCTSPDLLRSQIPDSIPLILTRRMVLQQVMKIFDPFGFFSPFLVLAKVYLRETWILRLGWDEALPEQLRSKWLGFFSLLFQMEDLVFERCMKPVHAVGKPTLVIMSDGSEMAYGCASYIRWTLEDGSFWCRLILAKCRIAPISRISIPQMELNGAVLSKRCRKVIEAECRYTFDQVYHFVDSETVLCMINKISTRFRVYEGVRIGEIQAACGGDLRSWGWISSGDNIADWVTRGRVPSELGPNSMWQRGPDFLYLPFDQWGAKFCPSNDDTLPGEKSVKIKVHVVSLSVSSGTRCSTASRMRWTFARILAALKARSFKGGNRSKVTPSLLSTAEKFLIQDAQTAWEDKDVHTHFRTLLPVKQDGLWVVGLRIAHKSPLTPDNRPHILMPHDHPFTHLLMKESHEHSGHRGRDATVAKFRTRFWTSHATKISKSVCSRCQKCKLTKARQMEQIMGQMPPDRLIPSPPFSSVMVDLFGPYAVRGEVQKRVSGKAWGVIFTDLCCRAVHIEITFGFDTQSFMLAFSRFVALRGCPSVIYSDPGSQLVGASAEITQAWRALDKETLQQRGAEFGMEWRFGPTDSPWYQGAVESLVKSVKKAIDHSIKGSRLSVPELLTAFTQIADLLKDGPLGVKPGLDSPLNILTPNSLLLGRSSSRNPGGYEGTPSLRSRLTLIQRIIDQFWINWTNLYAPTLVHQSKWLNDQRDLQVGDVVIVADNGLKRGEYRLARVSKVLPSADGKIRKAKVVYKRYKVGEKLHEYGGATDTEIERSVQRLALLVPVEDFTK